MKDYFKKNIIVVMILLSYDSKSQNAIEYKFPDNVIKLIAKGYSNSYYDTTKMYLYIRFQNNGNKYLISLSFTDKKNAYKDPNSFYLFNTNRYVLVNNIKLPLIFDTDILFNKGMATFSRESFIEFSTDGKIYKKSKELD